MRSGDYERIINYDWPNSQLIRVGDIIPQNLRVSDLILDVQLQGHT